MGFVFKFFLLVCFLSVAEVFFLLIVAGNTNILFTVFLCIITGILGGSLVRSRGIDTLRSINKALAAGQSPAIEVVEALMLLIVGVLLCVPGFLTDVFGFLMIIGGIRRAIAANILRKFKEQSFGSNFYYYTSKSGFDNTSVDGNSVLKEQEIQDATIVEYEKGED